MIFESIILERLLMKEPILSHFIDEGYKILMLILLSVFDVIYVRKISFYFLIFSGNYIFKEIQLIIIGLTASCDFKILFNYSLAFIII